ncbi:MAG: hypothetical protein ABIR52_15125 [Casimicrobiaceae bacterium]
MNTFNKKSLYAAIAGLSALGVTGVAQAVSVNPEGLGQALIYPYYTVRDQVSNGVVGVAPFNSLLSVVNSTASAKGVKVRFLEGKNSREVLDFNLYLSAKDVWTAAIIPTANGAGIFTADKSCTTPTVSSSSATPTEFVNFAYTGSASDGADASLDRTREGYVEIIEMGNLTGATAAAVTHASGVPSCSPLSGASADTVPGNGGLFGGITLVNVLSGEDITADAVALQGFSTTALWAAPGSILPNLQSVNPKTSVVTTGTQTYITDWTGANFFTIDPVSAVLMHNNVYNEFVLDTATKSGTDWVLTMPTKFAYYSGTAVQALFQRNFGAGGACDDVIVTQYDREERTIVSQTSFSPPPPTQTDSICWEANVITFNNSNVFGSKNVANIPTTFQNGWASLNFNGSSVPAGRHQLVGGASITFDTSTGITGSLAATTFNGLPTIGFAAQTFVNGTIPGATGPIQSNYGGNFVHKFTRSIQ